MASSSPGQGSSPLLGASEESPVPPTRDERLFLETQGEVLDWTRPQPGEDAAAAGRRRQRVKGLMLKAVAHVEWRLSCLALMREAGKNLEESKLPAFRVEVMALRDHCQSWWSLLLKLFKQAEGERSFGKDMMGRLQQARACGMGSPASPLGPKSPSPPMQAAEAERSAAGTKTQTEGGLSEEAEARMVQEPDKAKNLTRIPVVRLPRIDYGSEGRIRETTARRAGLQDSPVMGTPPSPPSLDGVVEKVEKKKVGGSAPVKTAAVGTAGVAGRGAGAPGVAAGRGSSTAGGSGRGVAGPCGAPAVGRGSGSGAVGRLGGAAVKAGTTSNKPGGATGRSGGATGAVGKAGAVGMARATPTRAGIGPPAGKGQRTIVASSSGGIVGGVAKTGVGGVEKGGGTGGSDASAIEVPGQEVGGQFSPVLSSDPVLEEAGSSNGQTGSEVTRTGSEVTRTGSEVSRTGSDVIEAVVSPQGTSEASGRSLEDFRVGNVSFGGGSVGEGDGEEGMDFLTLQEGKEWGDCEDGGAGGGSELMDVIRKLEEGSQPGPAPPQPEDGGERRGGLAELGVAPKEEWAQVCDSLMGGALLEGSMESRMGAQGATGTNNVEGGQEGTGERPNQVPGVEVRDPTLSQEKVIQAALKAGRSYASVAGARVRVDPVYQTFGAQNFANPPGEGPQSWSRGMGGPERKRRNVIQLRWGGTGQCPCRREVVDSLLGMGFKVEDIFAVIHPHNSREYDVSFATPVLMELFLTKYQLTGGAARWKEFVVVPLSRQDEVKLVTILVRNESIPAEDIRTWLCRYGQVEGPVNKGRDERGIWTGAWTVRMKLSRRGASVAHIPASAFIGRDRILVFYPGQPHLCFRCGSPSHLSRDCLSPNCVKCGAGGHVASQCREIRCNLCGEMGHPFSRCPKAHRGWEEGVVQVVQQQAGVVQRQEGQEAQQGQAAEVVEGGVGAGGSQGEKVKEKRARQVRRSERRVVERTKVEGGEEEGVGGAESRGVGVEQPPVVQPQEAQVQEANEALEQAGVSPEPVPSPGVDEPRPAVKARRVGGSRPPDTEEMEEGGKVVDREEAICPPRRKKKTSSGGDAACPANVDSAGDSAEEKEGWVRKEKKRKRGRNKGRNADREDGSEYDALSSAMETETDGETEGAPDDELETEELESEVEEAGSLGDVC